jgi:hypothetical protein
MELRQGLIDAVGIDINEAPNRREPGGGHARKGLAANPNVAARQADRWSCWAITWSPPDPADLPVRLPARYLAAGKEQARRPEHGGAFRGLCRRDGAVQRLHRVERPARPGSALPESRWHHERPLVLLDELGAILFIHLEVLACSTSISSAMQPELVRKALRDRQMDPAPVDSILQLDEQRRALLDPGRGRSAQGRAQRGLERDRAR